ncbi:MAG TPA: transcription elongation factor GreA [Gaiellaceae bacterium]|nr:transcription elongation factor GreA [Gaiellaceae bacterium]
MSAQTQPRETVLTRDGYEALRAELAELTLDGRSRVADELQQARGLAGDLEDNVELLEARREQERLEGRIAVLESVLGDARVIEESEAVPGVAGVGSEVEVDDVDSGAHQVFRLVGSPEAAPVEGRISVESPVGRSLLGRRSGDLVEVETPKGGRRLRVTRVRAARRRPAARPRALGGRA